MDMSAAEGGRERRPDIALDLSMTLGRTTSMESLILDYSKQIGRAHV